MPVSFSVAASVSVPAGPLPILPAELKKYKALRLMNEGGKRMLLAALQAAAEARLDLTIFSPTRAVIVSVADYDPQLDCGDVSDCKRLRRDTNPLWLLKVLPNMPASHLAILTKSGGPSHTVASHDQAMRLACALIVSGEADTVICADLATGSSNICRFTSACAAVKIFP